MYQTQAGGWHDDTGVEWSALGPPPASGAAHPWDGSGARGGAFPARAVYQAWKLLVSSGAADPTSCATFNYDVVNAGREVLAQVITALEGNLTAAVAAGKRPAVLSAAATLMGAYADLDELLGCEFGFLLGVWIKQVLALSLSLSLSLCVSLSLSLSLSVSLSLPLLLASHPPAVGLRHA